LSSHLQKSSDEALPAFGKFDSFDIYDFTNDLYFGHIVLQLVDFVMPFGQCSGLGIN
jgi:hypothetical protein